MSEELPTRVAVVHDWLVDFAGSERVLAEILGCLPQADLFSLVDHMPDAERAPLGGHRARTTFLQGMPGVANHLAWYLPLTLLSVFRPNLEDRIALTVLGEGWFPRRRMIKMHLERAA